MTDDQNDRVEILRLVLADVENERDRLRSARASWTARLGPLPASAAVVTGIIAAADGAVDWGWAAIAGFVFSWLLVVSVRFGGLKPYRELRHDYQAELDEGCSRERIGFRREETNLEKWLERKIRLEERVCGPPGERRSRRWPTTEVGSLAHALNVERAAANIVQALFVVIFVVLVVGIAVS